MDCAGNTESRPTVKGCEAVTREQNGACCCEQRVRSQVEQSWSPSNRQKTDKQTELPIFMDDDPTKYTHHRLKLLVHSQICPIPRKVRSASQLYDQAWKGAHYVETVFFLRNSTATRARVYANRQISCFFAVTHTRYRHTTTDTVEPPSPPKTQCGLRIKRWS